MTSLLEHKLIVVTGKGGAGKTTVACALGILAARSGRRTLLAELGGQHRIPTLFGVSEPPDLGEEVELEEGLWSLCIDPDRALIEWLRIVSGRISARVLSGSSTFHYFAAAAPGARELVSMIKMRDLCEGRRTHRHHERYDLVILDAPATGHALALLSSPQTFGSIVRMGPLAEQAQKVRELLQDSHRSGYVAVAHASEMAVTETLELEEGLRMSIDRDLDVVVVNGALPRRFSREEIARIASLTKPAVAARVGMDPALALSAVDAARSVYVGARTQRSQIARLRRQRFADGAPPQVLTVPLAFAPQVDLMVLEEIAAGLARKLSS
jgi:anion-transporting  ArsA/GET3 family ATPase